MAVIHYIDIKQGQVAKHWVLYEHRFEAHLVTHLLHSISLELAL